MTITTEHYGIHEDGTVTWLVQGRKGTNFVGLKQQCPFQVSGGMCNHLIPAAAPIPDRLHWDQWMKIFPDPLVQAMLPVPHDPGRNVFFVEDPYNDLALHIATLSRLSSPIKPIIRPAWTLKAKHLEKELVSSNIQPLVVAQANQKCQEIVDMIGQLSLFSVRTVVIIGAPDVVVSNPIQRIKTAIRDYDLSDLMVLPLENIGASLIRRYARREELDAPWETRDQRRNRQIQERS